MDPDTETFIDDLAAVGARQLAVLLHEYAVEDDDLAARLRLMAAVHKGRDAAMSAVNRGIRELVDGRGFYPWDQAATLAGRIDNLRRVTLDAFLDGSPETAVALLRSLVGSSGTVMTRVDDSSGRVGRAYAETISSWGAAWVAVGASDHRELAAQVLHEIATDDYGVKQNVLTAFQEALGRAGLMELRQLIQAELDHEPGEYRRGVWFHVSGGLNPYLFGGFSEKVGVGDDRARQGLTSGGAEPRPESGPGGRGFVCWIDRLGCFARG